MHIQPLYAEIMGKLLSMRIKLQSSIIVGAKPNVALVIFSEVINHGRGIEEILAEIPTVGNLSILILADEIVLSYPEISLAVTKDTKSIGEWLLQIS